MTVPGMHPILIGTAISGVGRIAGALLYGCLLIAFDLAFSAWRAAVARAAAPSRLGLFIHITFLARLMCILAAVGLALRLFDRIGVLLVLLAFTLSLPLRTAAAAYRARSREG